jgi:hypothetical protein
VAELTYDVPPAPRHKAKFNPQVVSFAQEESVVSPGMVKLICCHAPAAMLGVV